MRAVFTDAMKDAMKAGDKRRLSTVRMILAAIKDRDIAQRTAGKEMSSDDEILQLLAKMVKQREESARAYDDGKRADLAELEREEIAIIRDYMPQQMSDDEMKAACAAVIAELGAAGLRDMGRVMAALKERFAGKMDFGKASGVIKGLLQ